MRCSEVRKNLSAFLDGEMDEKEQLEIKAHLKDCSSCSREGELLRGSWEVLSEWKDIEPSSYFKTNFWRRVREQESIKRKPIFHPQLFPRWAAALATAAILLVFVSLYLSPRPGRGPSLPTLAREEFEMIDDWEIDLKEMMDELAEEIILETMVTEEMLNEPQDEEGGVFL
ncbi:zf-HC2 domain-containing protein [bacterium]|nr:zf-HC2 domain-containing protein [bacterium]